MANTQYLIESIWLLSFDCPCKHAGHGMEPGSSAAAYHVGLYIVFSGVAWLV